MKYKWWFNISGYEIKVKRDKDGGGSEGWITEFVKRGVISKRLKDFETIQ